MRSRVSRLVFLGIAASWSFPALASGGSTPTMQTSTSIGKAASAGSQSDKDANDAYTLKSSSRLVVLDVIVRDAQGQCWGARGLTKDDFKVIEAKQPQTVFNFALRLRAHGESPGVTIRSLRRVGQGGAERTCEHYFAG